LARGLPGLDRKSLGELDVEKVRVRRERANVEDIGRIDALGPLGADGEFTLTLVRVFISRSSGRPLVGDVVRFTLRR
jgi:hypothetical protein